MRENTKRLFRSAHQIWWLCLKARVFTRWALKKVRRKSVPNEHRQVNSRGAFACRCRLVVRLERDAKWDVARQRISLGSRRVASSAEPSDRPGGKVSDVLRHRRPMTTMASFDHRENSRSRSLIAPFGISSSEADLRFSSRLVPLKVLSCSVTLLCTLWSTMKTNFSTISIVGVELFLI